MSTTETHTHSNMLPPQSIRKLVLQSLGFGGLFIPTTILILFGITTVEWLRYDYLEVDWMWERGGFPCLGLFSIMSASFFLHKILRYRFAIALLVTVFATIVCWAFGGLFSLTPVMYKSTVVHWLRPEFMAWLLIPPWLSVATLTLLQKLDLAIIRKFTKNPDDVDKTNK